MHATDVINDNLDVQAILTHYDFDKVRNEGGMIRACCKLHGGNNPTGFVINPDTGLFYCHTGDCGGGDVFTLAQELEEISFTEAVKRIAEILHINIENLEVAERKSKEAKELATWINVMRKRRAIQFAEYVLPVETKEILKFRDFEEDTLKHFDVSFVNEITLQKQNGDDYKLTNRIAVPIDFGGKRIGVSMRKTKAKDYPKWSHQPQGLETSSVLYNYDAVQGEERIAVVEGMFDVWAFYEIGVPAVATFGAHITEEQYKLLMRTGAELIFAYDGDNAGRSATRKAMQLFDKKATCYTLDFDVEEDPASIERNQLKLKYESRRRLC